MSRRLSLIFVSIASSFLVAGCGGSASQKLSPGIDVLDPAKIMLPPIDHAAFGGKMTDDEFAAAEASVAAAIASSRVPDPTTQTAQQRADQIVAALNALPAIWRAERTASHDVMIQYRDGTPYLHLVGSELRAIGAHPISAVSSPSTPPLRLASRNPNSSALVSLPAPLKLPAGMETPGGPYPERDSTTLPEGNRAVILNVDNTGNDALPTVKEALEKRGYQVTQSAGTLEALESDMKNVDVAWISSHGASGAYQTSPNGPKIPIYVIGSTSPRFASCNLDPLCTKRTAQRNAFQIVGMGADIATFNSFGFTLNFVLEHFKFNRSSFMMLSTCSGLNPAGEATATQQAFQITGLGGLMGWDVVVWQEGSSASSKLVFDLALGANKVTGISPKQRPFSVDSLYEYLVQTGKDLEQSSSDARARLRYLRFVDRPISLTPSSIFLVPYEDQRHGYLYGEFGDRPQSEVAVELEGSPLTVLEANAGRIKVDLPASTLHGQVQVIVKNRKSNKLPLTMWQGTFSQKTSYKSCAGLFGTPGIEIEVVCNPMRFRADVHGYRVKAGGPIMSRPDGSAEVSLEDQVKDTDCEFKVTGESVKPAEIKIVPKAPLQGPVPWVHHVEHNDTGWQFILGSIDINNQQLRLLFNYLAEFKADYYGWQSTPSPGKWVLSQQDALLTAVPNILGMNDHRIQLGADFTMPPASSVSVAYPPSMGIMAGCGFEYSGQLNAMSAPDTETEH